MKKVIGLISLAMIICGLTSCVSIKSNVTEDVAAEYAYAAETMTPENSVVIIGMFPGVLGGEVVQEKPGTDKEIHKITEEVFVSKPVKPGTQYGIRNLTWTDQARGNFMILPGTTIGTKTNGLIEDVTCIDIKVPNKPGLYFMGSYATWDLAQATKEGVMVEYKDEAYWANSGNSSLNSTYEKLYKAVLPYYAGTEWEAYILKEIENLK